MRSVELFAGVGGLGMAVDEVFGTTPAWFCEFDDAPSRVLAHRYQGVPNFGDVTAVDWSQVERPTVLAGGFPCQDVSLAGRRRGMKDGTRSGLWSEFAKAIDVLRPDWVVIENVRGLLSAEAHSDVEPCPWCLGDDPDEPALRALGAVLGDLADLGFHAEWTSIRASDVGAPHGRFRVFILAWPAENTRYGLGRPAESGPARGNHASLGSNRRGSRSGHDPRLTLLPTPTVVMNDGESVESWSTRRERVKATGVNGNGMGMPLPIAVQLLPTPTVGNATGNAQRSGARADEKLLPGLALDYATDWGPYAAAIARWEAVLGRPAPSPIRMDGKGGKARLNPELPEWMMGWPAGWVTNPAIGLSRAQQLKAAGNGVVPQQAAAPRDARAPRRARSPRGGGGMTARLQEALATGPNFTRDRVQGVGVVPEVARVLLEVEVESAGCDEHLRASGALRSEECCRSVEFQESVRSGGEVGRDGFEAGRLLHESSLASKSTPNSGREAA